MNLVRVVRIVIVITLLTTCILLFTYKRKWKEATRNSISNLRDVPRNGSRSKTFPKNKTFSKGPRYNWSAAAMRFHQRKELLRRKCDWKPEYHIKKIWQRNSNLLVDLKQRLLICAVPKSGTTSWHRLLWTLQRERKGLDTSQSLHTGKDTLYNQGIVNHLSLSEGTRLIRRVNGDDRFWQEPPPKSSYRIILTRHPFARLISGWNQKFMLKSNYWVHLFQTHQGLVDYKKEIDMEHTMSFGDFARYVADVGPTGRLDFHFTPASTLCSPCRTDYLYVVKAERIDIDELWLLRRLNISHIQLGRKGIAPGGSLVNDNLVANIRLHMKKVDVKVIKRLYEFYKLDFELFGYSFNFTTLEAGGFD